MDYIYDIEAPMPRGDGAYVPPRRRYRTHAFRVAGKLARFAFKHPGVVGAAYGAVKATLGYSTPDHKKDFSAPSAPKKQKVSHNYSFPDMPNLRGEMSTQTEPDLSGSSQTVKRRKLQQIVSGDEANQLLRLPPCNYRLHSAKSMTLPGILNELFLPKLTSRLSFGFTSATGMSSQFPVGTGDNSVTAYAGLAPRGNYRGVALMKFRFTDKAVDRQEPEALNATAVDIATTVDSLAVNSHMRTFTSSPKLTNVGGGSEVNQLTIQDITSEVVTDNTKIRQLGAGANLTHFEDHAYQAPAFIASVGSVFNEEQIGTMDTEDVVDWNGAVPVLQGSGTTEDPYYYPQNTKEATMRIIDGFVEFDISNSSKTSAVIEVVLHSMKKTAVNINSPEVYKSIYNNYDYYCKSQYEENAGDANSPGGWQTFYDPKVPLLSCPKKFNKNIHANEVHRSNHVLGVGQSKKIKISLGSLTYKLGYKADTVLSSEPDNLKTYTKIDNVGTILVAIGHTGFDALESLVIPGRDVATNVLGRGLWAGKSPSPSSIVCSGLYQEQYYPMYMATSGRLIGNHNAPRPAYVTSGGGFDYNLPQNKIVATTVASVAADEVGAPISYQAADPN